MSEDTTIDAVKKSYHQPVDVFTHSRTGFPGAWSEEEIQILLDTWEEVLSRPRTRRFSISKKVHKRLGNQEGFKDVRKEDIITQMNTLRTEYTTYLGLRKIGLETVRHDYVDQLERIFNKTPKFVRQSGRRQRSNTEPSRHPEAISEDSDHSRSLSVTYGEKELESKPESNENKNEGVPSTRRGRFQRMNIQRLIRTMVNQQNAMMEQVQKLFTALEESNSKTAALLEDLVELQKGKEACLAERTEIMRLMNVNV